MKYLLDTHVLLLTMLEPGKLSRSAQKIVTDASIPKFISISSIWEIAIKNRIGKLPLSMGIDGVFDTLDASAVGIMGIDRQHIEIYTSLPLLHRDPFDGIIVATAMLEKMTIVTADENIQKYDVPWTW
ncbi:MAG: type II toxin-antitoxin system VapC family toxin [Defluviitaleaceae bacterium]|nr:type II toxin-antitoxin system VapC family toxin [Defluviitaleaceae bacterium]